MLKMFGWESRTEQQLAETRTTELTWLRRAKITQLINENLKCVFQAFFRPCAKALISTQSRHSCALHDLNLRDVHAGYEA